MASVPQEKNAARTRERIVIAAAHEFAAVGYGSATVRSIAVAAGVSPNLITRYFGGKEGLFAAASQIGLGVEAMFRGPRESLGARMAATILTRWRDVERGEPLLALMRSAGEHATAANTLATFLDVESLEPLRAQLENYGMAPAEALSRARSVDVFLVGVTTRLRMLRNDLAELPDAEEWVGSSIQRLIDGA